MGIYFWRKRCENSDRGDVYSTHEKDDNLILHEDVLASQKLLGEVIDDFKEKNKKDFKEGAFLGVWKSGDSVHIDVVRVAGSKEEALFEARKHNDVAIYDIKNNKVIYIL